MRTAILETAVTCLAERPYSEVSVALIAELADVSRGGMQHHFPTRLSLLQATVEFLHLKRLAYFRDDLANVPDGVDVIDHMIDSHWRHLNEREFRAYQELVLAARAEPKLSDLLAARYSAFLREWHDIAKKMSAYDYERPEVAKAGNVAHYMLEGMAYGQLGGQLTDDVVDQLITFAKTILRQAAD